MTASPLVTGWLKKEGRKQERKTKEEGGMMKMKVETKEYKRKEEKRSLEAGVTKGSPPCLLASRGLVRLEDSVALPGCLIPGVGVFLPRYDHC